MCFLIPDEISLVLTSFVWTVLCAGVLVICGNCCTRICGCSAAKSGIAGAKNNATHTAMISCVFIGLDAEYLSLDALEILSCRSRCWEAKDWTTSMLRRSSFDPSH